MFCHFLIDSTSRSQPLFAVSKLLWFTVCAILVSAKCVVSLHEQPSTELLSELAISRRNEPNYCTRARGRVRARGRATGVLGRLQRVRFEQVEARADPVSVFYSFAMLNLLLRRGGGGNWYTNLAGFWFVAFVMLLVQGVSVVHEQPQRVVRAQLCALPQATYVCCVCAVLYVCVCSPLCVSVDFRSNRRGCCAQRLHC